MESTPKKSIVGCYVIGGDSIYLSEDNIPDTLLCASDDFVNHFERACQKLTEKLECLVIVDHLLNNPETLERIFEAAKEHAEIVHIIPAVIAILQRAASHTCIISEERTLFMINIAALYLSYIFEKDGFLLSAVDVQMNSLKSLQSDYSEFSTKPVFCISGEKMDEITREQLGIEFPHIKIYHFKHHMKSLVVGGFCKALCIAEPGKHLEVANFTPGLFYGTNALVKPCSKFPFKLHFVPSANDTMHFGDTLSIPGHIQSVWSFKQLSLKNDVFDSASNCLLEYDASGVLKIQRVDINPFDIFSKFPTGNQKVQVWSADNGKTGSFNFDKNFVQLGPLSRDFKNLIANDWLNDEEQIVLQLTSTHSDVVTIFIDKKLNNYKNGPVISIAPSYIGLLQYCLSFFGPSCSKVLILAVTKNASKIYSLNQRSPYCFTVTYSSNLTQTYIDESITCGYEDVGLFYLTEKGSNKFLFFETEFKYRFIQSEIENCDETILYGGAIYALQNSYNILDSPYVTIDPLFDPEENDVDGLSAISRRTTTCFYEIEAFFHGALKSINWVLFYGDLTAILLRQQNDIHIFFFIHVGNKFLFKCEIIVSASVVIDGDLLHYADIVIVANYLNLKSFNFVEDIVPLNFVWPIDFTAEMFLEDVLNDNLIIFDTLPYAEAITKAVGSKIYDKKVYEKLTMVIEYSNNACKIVLDKDEYLTVSGAEYIPMYLSFSSTPFRLGNDAVEDLENFPESVIYDFLKVLEATSSTLSTSSYTFELAAMDDSDDPKLGYNVETASKSHQIISPEKAISLYFQRLIYLYEKHIGKTVDEIKFRLLNTVLTETQKEAFGNAAKQSNKLVVFSRY